MIDLKESFTMDNDLKSYIDKYDKFLEQQFINNNQNQTKMEIFKIKI